MQSQTTRLGESDTERTDRLLRANEVAALLAVSTRIVWRFRSEGRLPAVRIAGATRFRLSDVRRLIESGSERVRR